MKTSPDGLAFIAREEGEVDHAYYDVAHVLTIGVGHVITAADRAARGWGEGTVITHQQAMDLLAGDVAHAEGAVNAYVAVAMTQHQFDALVSFTFNVGAGALEKSGLLQKLNAGDVARAAAEFPDWCHAVKGGQLVKDLGLYNRRMAEQHMFLTPDASAAPEPQEDDATKAVLAAVDAAVNAATADAGQSVSDTIPAPTPAPEDT